MLAISQYSKWVAITTSDTVDLKKQGTADDLTSAIYVGGAGNVVAVQQDGTAITFLGVPVGTILPIRARRVNATSTTATNLVALYAL